ncbi:NUDIX hydrolase [Pendulispora albinea]|uniref:GDP-mannose pyrophosphatase n=1 Tax=Pendulispora albinea TaxID=2741071 RepID=A0ABZ2MBQ6_9BACT
MRLPAIRIAVAPDAACAAPGSFLSIRSFQLVAHYPNGSSSEPFAYDIVGRRALDAVIILAHHTSPDGEVRVFLRSCVRPPIVLREKPSESPELWEVPAGLVEPDEAPRTAAVRELAEELGITASETALEELGPWTYPAPGFIGERQIFFHVPVDPNERQKPTEDGSALEREAAIALVPLRDALDLARQGKLRDAKTELALRRLADLLIRP